MTVILSVLGPCLKCLQEAEQQLQQLAQQLNELRASGSAAPASLSDMMQAVQASVSVLTSRLSDLEQYLDKANASLLVRLSEASLRAGSIIKVAATRACLIHFVLNTGMHTSLASLFNNNNACHTSNDCWRTAYNNASHPMSFTLSVAA